MTRKSLQPRRMHRRPDEELSPAAAGLLLSKLAPEVLQRWEDRVRETIPEARHEDRLILFDEIPLFLARMALTLTGELVLRGDEVCREHGEERALATSYPINGVIHEYGILRKTICEALEEEAPLDRCARDAITEIIELAIKEAVDRFVDVQHGHLLECDRLKDEFVATLAHELRTPLSAVSNATYILETIQLDEVAMRQLHIVSRQTKNLNRLVQDIMDVAQITQNKVELRNEPLDLSRVVHDACESVQANCDAREQHLICKLPSKPLVVHGDAVRLEQVVTNLLNNAIHFTPAAGSVWLELEREGSEAVLRIRDSGVGIAAAMLPQIFGLFAQAETKSAMPAGLGIGLALVKRLVTLHNGSVAAHSEGEGCGTEFLVRLPLVSDSTAAEDDPVQGPLPSK